MGKEEKAINIFLAHTGQDTESINLKLNRILERAGLNVLNPIEFQDTTTSELLKQAQCSVHLVGNSLAEENLQMLENDFDLAHEKFKKDPNFNIFVWYPKTILGTENKKNNALLNRIQNSIYSNMIFSNHDSPVLFVEDIRSFLMEQKKVELHTTESDIFFIYNTIDFATAREIIDLLSDINTVEKLKIDPNNSADYSDFIDKQVNKSRLTVVYFQKAYDWAFPFMQQVWKLAGGASIKGNFLLIGDRELETVKLPKFEAPKVKTKLAPIEMMPLEIKMELG